MDLRIRQDSSVLEMTKGATHIPNPKSFRRKDPWLNRRAKVRNSLLEQRGEAREKVIESATESRKKVYLPSANPGDTDSCRVILG